MSERVSVSRLSPGRTSTVEQSVSLALKSLLFHLYAYVLLTSSHKPETCKELTCCLALFAHSAWASAYRNCEEDEDGYWLHTEGRLPSDLHGTLYRSLHF